MLADLVSGKALPSCNLREKVYFDSQSQRATVSHSGEDTAAGREGNEVKAGGWLITPYPQYKCEQGIKLGGLLPGTHFLP